MQAWRLHLWRSARRRREWRYGSLAGLRSKGSVEAAILWHPARTVNAWRFERSSSSSSLPPSFAVDDKSLLAAQSSDRPVDAVRQLLVGQLVVVAHLFL